MHISLALSFEPYDTRDYVQIKENLSKVHLEQSAKIGWGNCIINEEMERDYVPVEISRR